MPARVPFTVEAASPGWSTRYEVALGLHRSLLPAMRTATGFDQMHGRRWSLAVGSVDGGRASGVIGVPVDAWVEPMLEAMVVIGEAGQSLRIGSADVRLVEFALDDVVSAEAVNASPPRSRLPVEFASVTVFSAGDRGHRSVPDPRLIVGSWARAWAELQELHGGSVPGCPRETVDALGGQLAPVGGALQWSAAAFGRGARRSPPAMHGFAGSLILQLPRSAGEEERRWLGRLAALAPYVGTGAKPQNGLGHTLIPPGSADPSGTAKGRGSADAV